MYPVYPQLWRYHSQQHVVAVQLSGDMRMGDQVVDLCPAEYYSALKGKEIQPSATIWMSLDATIM